MQILAGKGGSSGRAIAVVDKEGVGDQPRLVPPGLTNLELLDQFFGFSSLFRILFCQLNRYFLKGKREMSQLVADELGKWGKEKEVFSPVRF